MKGKKKLKSKIVVGVTEATQQHLASSISPVAGSGGMPAAGAVNATAPAYNTRSRTATAAAPIPKPRKRCSN